MVEYRPECGIWRKENNNHLRLKRQRLMKLLRSTSCLVIGWGFRGWRI